MSDEWKPGQTAIWSGHDNYTLVKILSVSVSRRVCYVDCPGGSGESCRHLVYAEELSPVPEPKPECLWAKHGFSPCNAVDQRIPEHYCDTCRAEAKLEPREPEPVVMKPPYEYLEPGTLCRCVYISKPPYIGYDGRAIVEETWITHPNYFTGCYRVRLLDHKEFKGLTSVLRENLSPIPKPHNVQANTSGIAPLIEAIKSGTEMVRPQHPTTVDVVVGVERWRLRDPQQRRAETNTSGRVVHVTITVGLDAPRKIKFCQPFSADAVVVFLADLSRLAPGSELCEIGTTEPTGDSE